MGEQEQEQGAGARSKRGVGVGVGVGVRMLEEGGAERERNYFFRFSSYVLVAPNSGISWKRRVS
jgi:hypothetical protein